ncbi:MAG TPA: pyridoxamine 5'-phosphate oxidase family protein, partial [Methanofastidiosum sp.]|nr:pyridoxamine 5'-phosphate oxidase family protein [Methanofastidiosum sp.]
MERADKEIKNIHEIEDILNKARIIRLALCEDNIPYVIPLNFGYKNNTIYLHTSKIGKKIDILMKNNYVSFEADIDAELVKSKN